MAVKKTPISKSYEIEERMTPGLMKSTRKCGMKKRNPITAKMPGWPAPKHVTLKGRAGKYGR